MVFLRRNEDFGAGGTNGAPFFLEAGRDAEIKAEKAAVLKSAQERLLTNAALTPSLKIATIIPATTAAM